MANYLLEIKNELSGANVTQDNRYVLLSIFGKMAESEQESLLQLFRQNQNLLHTLSSLSDKKKEILASGNTTDWDKLIDEEEKLIEETIRT